jgi:hypothetical protein
MKTLSILSIGVILALLFSCREVYYPEDLESNEDIPVIQAIIMNNQMPEVKIYWAVDYESDEIRYVSDADITMTDEFGTVTGFYESWSGHYYGNITGIEGRTYTLRIVFDDGREFRSTPQLLQFAPQVDSLYVSPGKHSEYQYGASGKPVYTHMQGLFVKTDLSSVYPNTLYYRFNTRVVKLSSYTVDINSPSSYSVYLWETTNLDDSYSVNRSVTLDNTQVLYKHPAGFLRYYYDPSLQTSTSTAPYTDSWVITQSIYSISTDVYNYYNSVGNLLNGSDRIFSPVASQVKSNIFCVSDPKEKVIGLFEASSLTTIYRAFGWKGLDKYRFKNLDYYPDVGTGSQDRYPPYFWIYFF